jgi:hypothetical protein
LVRGSKACLDTLNATRHALALRFGILLILILPVIGLILWFLLGPRGK